MTVKVENDASLQNSIIFDIQGTVNGNIEIKAVTLFDSKFGVNAANNIQSDFVYLNTDAQSVTMDNWIMKNSTFDKGFRLVEFPNGCTLPALTIANVEY